MFIVVRFWLTTSLVLQFRQAGLTCEIRPPRWAWAQEKGKCFFILCLCFCLFHFCYSYLACTVHPPRPSKKSGIFFWRGRAGGCTQAMFISQVWARIWILHEKRFRFGYARVFRWFCDEIFAEQVNLLTFIISFETTCRFHVKYCWFAK